MNIDFEKWQGTKNDFIVVWIRHSDLDLIVPTFERLAQKLCSRDGSGVGADGIIILSSLPSDPERDIQVAIINSDGSQASNCGNGLRCAAQSARRRFLAKNNSLFDGVTFKVKDQSIDCRYLGDAYSKFVAVTMPTPTIGADNSYHNEVLQILASLQKQQKALDGDVETVNLGNSHVVLTLLNQNVSREMLNELAKLGGVSLQQVKHGDGTNFHLAVSRDLNDRDRQQATRDLGEGISELWAVSPWERGAGATQSCGSGACAVAVAILATGLTERRDWIAIDMPGGRLYVKQSEPLDHVILAGPAELVFVGQLDV